METACAERILSTTQLSGADVTASSAIVFQRRRGSFFNENKWDQEA